MITKVKKWGNSLAVRLPKKLAEESHVFEGSEVLFQKDSRGLLLKPQQHKPDLNKLLKKMKKNTIHSAVDWGKSKGREIW